MKSLKLTSGLIALALGVANAASSYSVDLKKAVTVGSTELQAGHYKVAIEGEKAVFKSGKNVIEVPATIANGDQKFGTTGIVTLGPQLVEIDLGGSTQKIVFNTEARQSAGGGK